VSGVTPGSASDTLARIISEKLHTTLGQPVIVENKLGAGGLVGAKYVANSEPDGHMISIYTSAFTVAPLLNPKALDPTELTPVAMLATVPTALVVNPSKGYKTVADLVAAAKAHPGRLIASSAGVGSSTHMNLERFRIAAGIEVLHVPLKGAPEGLTEVIAGRADLYFAPAFSAMAHIKDGKLVALAVGSPKRTALLPDVPTTVEAGYPDSDYNFWVGALVPAKTPREIVERLNREINNAVQLPDVRERFIKVGADPLTMTVSECDAMIKRELETNARLIKQARIQAN
jgi:tripartite-type tricarboxylate transporter receptor subunit TctC